MSSSYPSIDRARHTDLLSSTYVPFSPFACSLLTKERLASQETPTTPSLHAGHPTLRASGSFMDVLLPALYRSQAQIRSLCSNDKTINRACRAASKTSNHSSNNHHPRLALPCRLYTTSSSSLSSSIKPDTPQGLLTPASS